jgi:hypothetical protein
VTYPSRRGLGRSFVEAALSHGDKVAAQPHATPKVSMSWSLPTATPSLPLELDVADKAAVFETANQAKEHFKNIADSRTRGYDRRVGYPQALARIALK